jgi:uncharacterized protein YyaL (SSP411 family)
MTNRLSKETSPYLLQHQHNPVDWFPWGEEALSRAKKENKPILLSIGYSACHWCHVMEHESFENSETARLMNENFINIKVDREERPDLDQIYQNVAQALTQGGGWPLTVFLTPDLRPYFGGTYFPPEDRWGRPGFPRVLHAISDAFKNDHASVLDNAQKLTEFIAAADQVSEGSKKTPRFEDLRPLAQTLLGRVDWQRGGLGDAPKFPNTMIFSFLWRWGTFAQSQQALNAVRLTLTQMAKGGVYDQLGGGFHRYSVDESWSVPHFEKMLYDNALLLKLYSEVLLTPNGCLDPKEKEFYLEVIRNTVQYVFREMTSPEGGFYSAQDADTEGEEGKYFVWDLQDLNSLLPEKDASIFALLMGVTEGGNFEDGKTVLYRAHSEEEVAEKLGIPWKEVSQSFQRSKHQLLEARKQRVAPGLDTKVLTSWNGLMVSGLAWASQALKANGEKELGEQVLSSARRAFSFLSQKVSRDSNRLWSTYQGGKGKHNGYLDDYASLAMAGIDLSRFSKTPAEVSSYLDLSKGWILALLKHFKDSVGNGYFFTSDDHEKLIQRPKTTFDQAIPSGTAMTLNCLNVMSELISSEEANLFRKEVEEQIPVLFSIAEKNPYGMGEFLCAALLFTQGPVTLSGENASPSIWHPHVLQKNAPELKAGLLICHNQVCSSPISDPTTIRHEVLSRLGFSDRP